MMILLPLGHFTYSVRDSRCSFNSCLVSFRTYGQDRTGQDRTGQNRTGQDRAGQAEQDRAGKDKHGQGWGKVTGRSGLGIGLGVKIGYG